MGETKIELVKQDMSNVQITEKMCEELKREIFMDGSEAIDNFLDFECPYDDKDTIDRLMDEVISQMPPEEFMKFYCEYFMNEHTYPYNYKTERFYFTFGSDPTFPYQNGWLVIEAPNEQIARNIFASLYPNPDGPTLRCAFVYPESVWKTTSMYKTNSNFGKACYATFKLTNTLTD